MSDRIIVISGVAGMTGSQTARQLLRSGARVIGFDNFFASSAEGIQDLLANPRFTFLEYDLREQTHMNSLEEEVQRWRSQAELSFIHCAAVVHTKYFYQPSATFDVNVIGTRDFLELAIRQQAARFINCSTSEVYSLKSFAEGGVRESDLLGLSTAESTQRTSYATGKLMTEFFVREAVEQGRVRGCSIRFANVYSADEEIPEHIIPYTIESLIRSNEITLLENARDTYRTFLHNHDSCNAVIALLSNDRALDGTVYNVGTDEEVAIVDLVQRIALKLGRSDLVIRFEGTRSADPPRRLLNTEKIRSRTGWSPNVSLDEGLDACIAKRRARVSDV